MIRLVLIVLGMIMIVWFLFSSLLGIFCLGMFWILLRMCIVLCVCWFFCGLVSVWVDNRLVEISSIRFRWCMVGFRSWDIGR